MEFGIRYIRYRDNSISDLYDFKLPEGKVKYNNIHYCLMNRSPISAEILGSNYISLDYDKTTLLKAIIGEIELFRAKSLIQKENLIKGSSHISPCWNFVTAYYYNFYQATLFTRFSKNGFIFLNNEKTRYISNVTTALSSDLISINPGNYSFRIEEVSTNVLKLFIKKSDRKPHEALWLRTQEILKEIKLLSNTSDIEELVYKLIIQFQNKPQMHSEMRNLVNYRPLFALKSLNNEIESNNFIDFDNDKLVKKIISSQTSDENETTKQMRSLLIGELLARVNEKLYTDYIERSKSSGLKRILKARISCA